MPNITPYSNFHELNLDWLLQKVKQLEDTVADITGSADPSNDPPVMDGVAAPGVSANYSRGDHVHPTDTSRASASDLSDLDTREYNDYVQLQGDINTVDAKIAFSSAAPLMDSDSASSGSSPYQARADHVHPTDTSRASALDVATLMARMDAFAGSANPSDTTPQMDGVGSAGTGGNYSRGDHVHPSDTSKVNKSGDTITGDLTVEGFLTSEKIVGYFSTNSIGWRRIVHIPQLDGNSVYVKVVRKSAAAAEIHEIQMDITTTVKFDLEHSSNAGTNTVDKIRYSDAGYIDIHVDQVTSADYEVEIEPLSPTPDSIELADFSLVDDAPAGETIVEERNLYANASGIKRLVVDSINGISIEKAYTSANEPKSFHMDNETALYLIAISAFTASSVVYQAFCGSTGTVYPNKLSGGSNFTVSTSANTFTITSTSHAVKLLAFKL